MATEFKLKLDAKKAGGPPPLPRVEKPPFLPDDPSVPKENAPPESVGRNRSLLIVDDNEAVLKAFELKLKASGFAVTTTSNATNVTRVAGSAKAELIILDVNFPSSTGPDWSGYTVLQWLRRFPEVASIPVILISGEDAAKHKEKALAEGAVGFFQKPVSYQELLTTILRALEDRQ